MDWHRINLKDQKSIDIIKGIDVVLNVLSVFNNKIK